MIHFTKYQSFYPHLLDSVVSSHLDDEPNLTTKQNDKRRLSLLLTDHCKTKLLELTTLLHLEDISEISKERGLL